MGFTDYVTLRRQHSRKHIPVICVECTIRAVLHFVIEPSKGCSITIAENPGHGLACITVNCFEDPNSFFFEPTKCHISSNSMCFISAGTSGSGSLMANS